MNQLNERDMELHTKILGWLYIVVNGAFLLLGAVSFLVLVGFGFIASDEVAFSIFGIIGIFAGFFFLVLTLPGVIAGYGLLTRKSWARILAIVIGILGLLNFPLGTVIGLYTMWVLFQDEASDYFMPLKTVPAN